MLGELLEGTLLGIFTGITPGIHVNTLAKLSGSFFFLLAMGLTHTFIDAFPSAFLGVPDEETAFSVLPAHRMILRGKGNLLIELALWSSFLAVVVSIILWKPYTLLAELYRPRIGKYLVFLIAVFLILSAGRKAPKALLIFVLSGILGYTALERLFLNEPYYHLFTGLFGVPILMSSFREKAPPQGKGERLELKGILGPVVLGSILGMFSSLIPALTASIAASMVVPLLKKERDFLSVVYSVNTSNFLFGVFNYMATGRERNGVVVAMANSNSAVPDYISVAMATLFVGSLALLIGLPIGQAFMKAVGRIPYKPLNRTILAALLGLSWYFDGIIGLWVLLTASGIGYLAGLLKVRRTNCMGVLIVPILAG
ncbi:tripartite tricarboxylate transporter permease [Thermococcus gorgonarius]|uniref:DUF112 domain-containing protein n=1 Tax=Thermococcus gorgonarius TaxID=71997 RepID=A0A2Z2MF70_THEGO|nr:tripartite tricarboxylate transporter permease [Thermococcus gorgonarius]ASJ01101.1 hypothetical protein A3K92_06205 [Thermococcus gorgonarius]